MSEPAANPLPVMNEPAYPQLIFTVITKDKQTTSTTVPTTTIMPTTTAVPTPTPYPVNTSTPGKNVDHNAKCQNIFAKYLAKLEIDCSDNIQGLFKRDDDPTTSAVSFFKLQNKTHRYQSVILSMMYGKFRKQLNNSLPAKRKGCAVPIATPHVSSPSPIYSPNVPIIDTKIYAAPTPVVTSAAPPIITSKPETPMKHIHPPVLSSNLCSFTCASSKLLLEVKMRKHCNDFSLILSADNEMEKNLTISEFISNFDNFIFNQCGEIKTNSNKDLCKITDNSTDPYKIKDNSTEKPQKPKVISKVEIPVTSEKPINTGVVPASVVPVKAVLNDNSTSPEVKNQVEMALIQLYNNVKNDPEGIVQRMSRQNTKVASYSLDNKKMKAIYFLPLMGYLLFF